MGSSGPLTGSWWVLSDLLPAGLSRGSRCFHSRVALSVPVPYCPARSLLLMGVSGRLTGTRWTSCDLSCNCVRATGRSAFSFALTSVMVSVPV